MKQPRLRLDPTKRREMIVSAAKKLTKERNSKYGWTLADVAEACEVATTRSNVKRYFPTIDKLRDAVGND